MPPHREAVCKSSAAINAEANMRKRVLKFSDAHFFYIILFWDAFMLLIMD